MYVHDYTNPKDIIYDLAKQICTGDNIKYENNWKLVFPRLDSETAIADGETLYEYPNFWTGNAVTKETFDELVTAFNNPEFKQRLQDAPSIVLKAMPRIYKEWKSIVVDINDVNTTSGYGELTGVVTLDISAEGYTERKIAKGGQVRINLVGKKSNFYRTADVNNVKVTEFYVTPTTATSQIVLPSTVETGQKLVIEYEQDLSNEVRILGNEGFYLELTRKQSANPNAQDGLSNYHYLTWRMGDTYNVAADGLAQVIQVPEEIGGVPTGETINTVELPKDAWGGFDFVENNPIWSWYTYPATSIDGSGNWDWLPIEYYLTVTQDAMVGVLMGDVGISVDDYLASPAYFGSLSPIEGALTTDTRGNFAGFSGSSIPPILTKKYGDYTGTGITDVMMVSTKSGRPYQGHKLGLFGLYEFKEQTFNGLSAHTNKYSMTEIVVADVHENERGILKNCLAGPKVGKEHGVELVDKRYDAEEEESYIFLNTKSYYTPFNTSNDSLIGFAIKIS